MGQLVSQAIKTLFNGVSRQPHNVRLPSQVQESTNTLHSVVTGGFEKRPATQHIAALAGADPNTEYAVHAVERDAAEQYIILLPANGTVLVYDALTGAQKTVNAFDADVAAYITGDPADFAFVSVEDSTFIVNRTKVTAMLPATSGTITGYKTNFLDLASVTGSAGQVYKITGDATTIDDYYVTWDATQSTWVEGVNPNGQNSFDPKTMPHRLARQSDGTFNLERVTWNDRAVGDEQSCPKPSFIGQALSDVFFYRNRLGMIGGEFVFMSQSGDFFNLFPDKSTQVLDADPIDDRATASRVVNLRWALPFRKALFLTADKDQFEINVSGLLTPNTKAVDITTSYDSAMACRPVVMGDQLYFAADTQSQTVLWEYHYDYTTLSNTATDVIQHATGYVAGKPLQMASSPAHGRLFMRTDGAADTIYSYSTFWQDLKKAQSAWNKYTFDGASVLGIASLTDFLYLVIKRGSQICIERLTADTEPGTSDVDFPVASNGKPYAILLDRRVKLTGTYDAGTNVTTWTLPYQHNNDVLIVLSQAFPNGQRGRQLNVTYPSNTTVAATGDFSAAAVYAGVTYEMYAELSKQFLRDQGDSSIITGRLQLRTMTVSFKETGYFEARVTPVARAMKTYKMPGRVLGSANFLVGSPNVVEDGQFKFKIGSRADTVVIAFASSSYLPCTITSAAWVGFYNEVSRNG